MAKFNLLPIGGLGEVGMNNMLFQTEGFSFLFDCGTTSSHSPWLGYDSIFPDYAKIFSDEMPWPDAVLISHGHEDHIGALPHFVRQSPKKVQIYATSFTAELIRKKLKEHSLDSKYELLVQKQTESFDLGPWEVTYFFNNHSIIDSNCLSLKLDSYHVFHTGDFRIDSEEYKDPIFDVSKILPDIGPVNLLMSDSTNAEREGWSEGEGAIGDTFARIMQETEGACIVTFFASNVRRLQHIVEASKEQGRKLVFVGRSMEKFVDLCQQYNVFQVKGSERAHWDELQKTSKSELTILLTGSQGEHQAALSRMAHGKVRGIDLDEKDCLVFSALQIPGNESKIRYLINKFAERGVRVIKNSESYKVHTTGHAYQEELRSLLTSVQPDVFVPVHGDRSMLNAHAEIGRSIENVDTHLITNGIALGIEDSKVEAYAAFDRPALSWSKFEYSGSVEDRSISEKKKIAKDGLVYFSFSEASLFNGKWAASIDCVACHYVDLDYDSGVLITERMMGQFFAGYDPKKDMKEWFRNWIRSYFRKKYGMKPVIKVLRL